MSNLKNRLNKTAGININNKIENALEKEGITVLEVSGNGVIGINCEGEGFTITIEKDSNYDDIDNF